MSDTPPIYFSMRSWGDDKAFNGGYSQTTVRMFNASLLAPRSNYTNIITELQRINLNKTIVVTAVISDSIGSVIGSRVNNVSFTANLTVQSLIISS